jgi:hypothetical protein
MFLNNTAISIPEIKANPFHWVCLYDFYNYYICNEQKLASGCANGKNTTEIQGGIS